MSSTVIIYDENVEWTTSATAGTFNFADNSNPHTGLIDLDVLHANPGDTGTFTAPTPIVVSFIGSLSLWISPVSWAIAAVVTVGWQDSSGNALGNSVVIQSGRYGFNNTLASYQNLVIPIGDFSIPSGSKVDKLVISAFPKTTMSFFVDTIVIIPATSSSCMPQVLEAQATCLDCGLSRKQLAAVESFILSQMAVNVGLFTKPTPSSLLAAAACFNCLNKKQLEMVLIYLVCQLTTLTGFGTGLALSNNPSVLMNLAKCFNCGLPNRYLLMIDVYVVSVIANSQGLLSSTAPSSLLAAANCFDCLTAKMREAVIDNLFCQLSTT